MLTRYCNHRRFAQVLIVTVALLVFGGADALGQVNYSGNGNIGFGGVLGNGSFDINDDGTTVTLTFNRGTDNFGDALVVYIDSKSGGFASTSSFTDTGDKNRKAISGYDGSNRSTVNFPTGFRPDYAISAIVANDEGVDFAGLWELKSGTHNFIKSVNISSTDPAASSYDMTFDFTDVGTSSGAESFGFVASYLNQANAFRSDEAIGDGIASGNPGASPVTFDTYFQYSSGDEGGLATTTAAGNWSSTATWTNGNVPLSGDDVEIDHNVTLDQNATVTSLSVSTGNEFTASSGGNGYELTVADGGSLSNNGTFTASDGKVIFSGTGSVSGTVGFNDVDISDGVNFGSSSTVNGVLSVKGGGFADTNAPTYGDGSTLEFDTGGSYTIDGSTTLWTTGATRGQGVPDNVTVASTGPLEIFEARDVTGDLTVSSSASVTQGNNAFIVQGDFQNSGTYSFVSDGAERLTVQGKLTNKSGGTITLSDVSGGDVELEGDFDNNGTFNSNNRAIFFIGSGTQELDAANDQFGFLVFNNTGGGVKLVNSDVTVEGSTGDPLQFKNSGGLDLNGQTVTLSGDGGNILVDGGARSITSSSGRGTFEISGTKTITSANSGVLELGGNTTLELQSDLTTNGNLTLTSTSETSTAYISGSGSGTVSGNVTFERQLNASGDHFRFLSAPTATLLDDEGSGSNAGNLLSNMWTQSETGTGADAAGDPSVFVYNEAANLSDPPNTNLANGWESIGQSNGNWGELNDLSALPEQSSAPIDPGRGFLAFMFADQDFDGTNEGFPLTLSATGSVQTEENSDAADPPEINPPITFNGSDGDGLDNNGWNLIANPFMAPIDWESIENDGNDLDAVDATIYVWDAEAGQYATYTANGSGDSGGSMGGSDNQDQFIAPFQAFFVKATGSGSGGNGPDIGGIDSGDKDTGQSPEVKGNETPTPQIALQLRAEGDSTGETTGFRYTEAASAGKDAYDAYQLEPLSSARTLVASEMSGTDALFDHQNRPPPAEQDTIGLALDITEGGTYTLSASTLQNLPGDWKVILENTDSGARWDLGAGESVSFDVSGTASTSQSADASPAALLKDGPTVAKASTDNGLPSYRLFVGPAAALPVELASFDATTEGPEVQLSWQTASETNNAGFAIERRAQGGTWSQIGFREGAGTTSEAQTYRFTDGEIPFEAETVRYRLRQTDLDGSTTLSDEVTVELGAPSKARLHAPFPNPTTQRATVRYEVPKTTTVQIAVYDVLGRRVETVVDGQIPAGRAQKTVQTERWAPGIYFVRMQLGDTVHTERISVVR